MTDAVAAKPVTFAHRVEFALYRGLERLLAEAPLDVVAVAGETLGRLARRLSPKHRRLATRNLRIATANHPTDEAAIAALVSETFRRAGANLLASLRTAVMTPEEIEPYLEVEGQAHLHPNGSGTVIVCAHMGNWEMLAQAYRYLGDDVHGGTLYRPLANPLIDQMVRTRRRNQGAEVFSKFDGFHAPAATLRDGSVVAVLSDQRAGGHGELVPFFGRLSSCSPLPSLLARRARARMVILSISSISGGWRMRIRPVRAKADTAEVMDELETAMRDSLSDVFWFHDRWRVDAVRPLHFYTKGLPTEPAKLATVPTRALVTLPPGDPSAVETLVRLLEIRPDARLDVLDDGRLPELPHDDRIARVEWDPDCPPEHLPAVLRRSDESQPAPLDFALLLDGHRDLARAARKFGLRAVIGVGSPGKPWTRAFERPTHEAGWRWLADELLRKTPPPANPS